MAVLTVNGQAKVKAVENKDVSLNLAKQIVAGALQLQKYDGSELAKTKYVNIQRFLIMQNFELVIDNVVKLQDKISKAQAQAIVLNSFLGLKDTPGVTPETIVGFYKLRQANLGEDVNVFLRKAHDLVKTSLGNNLNSDPRLSIQALRFLSERNFEEPIPVEPIEQATEIAELMKIVFPQLEPVLLEKPTPTVSQSVPTVVPVVVTDNRPTSTTPLAPDGQSSHPIQCNPVVVKVLVEKLNKQLAKGALREAISVFNNKCGIANLKDAFGNLEKAIVAASYKDVATVFGEFDLPKVFDESDEIEQIRGILNSLYARLTEKGKISAFVDIAKATKSLYASDNFPQTMFDIVVTKATDKLLTIKEVKSDISTKLNANLSELRFVRPESVLPQTPGDDITLVPAPKAESAQQNSQTVCVPVTVSELKGNLDSKMAATKLIELLENFKADCELNNPGVAMANIEKAIKAANNADIVQIFRDSKLDEVFDQPEERTEFFKIVDALLGRLITARRVEIPLSILKASKSLYGQGEASIVNYNSFLDGVAGNLKLPDIIKIISQDNKNGVINLESEIAGLRFSDESIAPNETSVRVEADIAPITSATEQNPPEEIAFALPEYNPEEQFVPPVDPCAYFSVNTLSPKIDASLSKRVLSEAIDNFNSECILSSLAQAEANLKQTIAAAKYSEIIEVFSETNFVEVFDKPEERTEFFKIVDALLGRLIEAKRVEIPLGILKETKLLYGQGEGSKAKFNNFAAGLAENLKLAVRSNLLKEQDAEEFNKEIASLAFIDESTATKQEPAKVVAEQTVPEEVAIVAPANPEPAPALPEPVTPPQVVSSIITEPKVVIPAPSAEEPKPTAIKAPAPVSKPEKQLVAPAKACAVDPNLNITVIDNLTKALGKPSMLSKYIQPLLLDNQNPVSVSKKPISFWTAEIVRTYNEDSQADKPLARSVFLVLLLKLDSNLYQAVKTELDDKGLDPHGEIRKFMAQCKSQPFSELANADKELLTLLFPSSFESPVASNCAN